MRQNDISLGLLNAEVLLPIGRTYTESVEYITREERTASGRLVREIVAEKKAFNLAFSLLTNAELLIIEAIESFDQELSLKILNSDSFEDCYTVLMSPLSKKRVAVGDGLWGGVNMNLSEV